MLDSRQQICEDHYFIRHFFEKHILISSQKNIKWLILFSVYSYFTLEHSISRKWQKSSSKYKKKISRGKLIYLFNNIFYEQYKV